MSDHHELVLTRLLDAPREALYRCWTEPALLTPVILGGGRTLFPGVRQALTLARSRVFRNGRVLLAYAPA